jgi:hypothetical protein
VNRSYNDAPISGAQQVGGLVGDGFALAISSSFNTATVSGTFSVGGLAGQINSTWTLENSFNVGSVSGTNDVGGIIGRLTSPSGITTSYNAGSVSTSGATKDGLIAYAINGGALTISTFSAYSAIDTRYLATSTITQMQSADLYVGWDFATIWGFGTCDENGGLPMLRFANPGLTYYSNACSVVTVPQTGSSSTPAPEAPAPTYQGPTVDSSPVIVRVGSEVTLTGKKLDSVTAVFVLGQEVSISALSATTLTIFIPEGTTLGLQDLELVSSFGRLTLMAGILVTEALPSASFGELLGYRWVDRFTGNSRALAASQQSSVELDVAAFGNATTIVCWGYTTASEPKPWAIDHAKARAQSACDLVSKLAPSTKVVVRVRYGVPKSAAMRASLQFWISRSN